MTGKEFIEKVEKEKAFLETVKDRTYMYMPMKIGECYFVYYYSYWTNDGIDLSASFKILCIVKENVIYVIDSYDMQVYDSYSREHKFIYEECVSFFDYKRQVNTQTNKQLLDKLNALEPLPIDKSEENKNKCFNAAYNLYLSDFKEDVFSDAYMYEYEKQEISNKDMIKILTGEKPLEQIETEFFEKEKESNQKTRARRNFAVLMAKEMIEKNEYILNKTIYTCIPKDATHILVTFKVGDKATKGKIKVERILHEITREVDPKLESWDFSTRKDGEKHLEELGKKSYDKLSLNDIYAIEFRGKTIYKRQLE